MLFKIYKDQAVFRYSNTIITEWSVNDETQKLKVSYCQFALKHCQPLTPIRVIEKHNIGGLMWLLGHYECMEKILLFFYKSFYKIYLNNNYFCKINSLYGKKVIYLKVKSTISFASLIKSFFIKPKSCLIFNMILRSFGSS